MTTIQTLFGTYNSIQLKAIKSAIDEINESMMKLDSEKTNIKNIVDATFDSLKIPKKILRRIAKVHYKQSFQEEVAESKEFEALFEGITEVK